MEMPLPEIFDRLSIIKLKVERIGEPHLDIELKEYENALEEFKEKGVEIDSCWLEELYKINSRIWDLESDIRKGKENKLGLEEVGKRAIMIREENKKRVAVKNKIFQETGLGFKDVKMNHASE